MRRACTEYEDTIDTYQLSLLLVVALQARYREMRVQSVRPQCPPCFHTACTALDAQPVHGYQCRMSLIPNGVLISCVAVMVVLDKPIDRHSAQLCARNTFFRSSSYAQLWARVGMITPQCAHTKEA